MLLDVVLHLIPESLIVADLFAEGADGHDSAQGLDLVDGGLDLADQTLPFLLGLLARGDVVDDGEGVLLALDLDGIGNACDSVSTLFIRASSPEAENNRITPSTPFTILIWINNTSFNLDLTSGGFSFNLYSPDGSIENVIHDDHLGYLSTGSVLYLNDFDSCFELGIFSFENGWDSAKHRKYPHRKSNCKWRACGNYNIRAGTLNQTDNC